MITVRLLGGLGNQLFQYALYVAFQEKGIECNIDDNIAPQYVVRKAMLKEAFGLDYERYDEKMDEIPLCEYYEAGPENRFAKAHLEYYKYLLLLLADKYWYSFFRKQRIIVHSYFQDYRIFKSRKVSKRLRNELTFTDERKNKPAFSEWLNRIKNTPSASLHFRRDDYLQGGNVALYGGICTEEYYQKAIEIVLSKEKDAIFYVFSDDKEYIREKYNDERFIIVDDDNLDDLDEFFLMSSCKHHVLANSTFSWWSAWLDDNPNSIKVAPEKWLNKPTQPHLHMKRMNIVSCGGVLLKQARYNRRRMSPASTE